MFKKTKLRFDDIEEILLRLQDKFRVTDFEVDMVYLKHFKKMMVTDIIPMLYKEYYPEKKIPAKRTMYNMYNKHMNKENVQMYVQDVFQECKNEYAKRNSIMTLGERMEFLSKVVSGEVKEPAKSPYGGVYQREADIKTKIQAVNILNDFDLKTKEMNTDNVIKISIVGEPIEMNAFKHSKAFKHESDMKVYSEPPMDKALKDVMDDEDV